MIQMIRGARARRAERLCGRILPVVALGVFVACDAENPGLLDPGLEDKANAALFPDLTGAHALTGTATAATESRHWGPVTCEGIATIPTQTDSTFSGTFEVAHAGDCKGGSGTLWGTVRPDGSVSMMADTPHEGDTVWEDAAHRSGCSLVSSPPFTGTVTDAEVSVTGTAAYDCWFAFPERRVDVTVHVTATRS